MAFTTDQRTPGRGQPPGPGLNPFLLPRWGGAPKPPLPWQTRLGRPCRWLRRRMRPRRCRRPRCRPRTPLGWPPATRQDQARTQRDFGEWVCSHAHASGRSSVTAFGVGGGVSEGLKAPSEWSPPCVPSWAPLWVCFYPTGNLSHTHARILQSQVSDSVRIDWWHLDVRPATAHTFTTSHGNTPRDLQRNSGPMQELSMASAGEGWCRRPPFREPSPPPITNVTGRRFNIWQSPPPKPLVPFEPGARPKSSVGPCNELPSS